MGGDQVAKIIDKTFQNCLGGDVVIPTKVDEFFGKFQADFSGGN
jgi:hypothetical protein